MSPDESPRITNVLFAAPKNDADARTFLLSSQIGSLGSTRVRKNRVPQKIVNARIGWYSRCVS